ncbi:MAG: hypothetical protein H6Q67_1882 [Firmicutes bacterium]|nr:hypothetical protein [Bacillota bacterium]
MGTYYTIKFTPEESSNWIAYETNKELGVTESAEYELYSETVVGRLKYYIINDKGEKAHDIWEKVRGDFITLF